MRLCPSQIEKNWICTMMASYCSPMVALQPQHWQHQEPIQQQQVYWRRHNHASELTCTESTDGHLQAMAARIHEKAETIAQSSGFLSSIPHSEVPLLDRCDIEVAPHVLGKGAFSEVYPITNLHSRNHWDNKNMENVERLRANFYRRLASGHHHQTAYALKQLRRDLAGKQEDFESAAIDLCIEAKFLTRLNHPNIIKVRGLAKGWTSAFAKRHDGFFLVMDRLEPLDTRIARWRDRLYHFPGARQPTFSRKMHYSLHVAAAISYLHDRRIIFRDLKPSNVGFKLDDTVQLFDFGLARELPKASSRSNDETFLMSGVGTRRFMAPEVVNSNTYNAKADCYSWAMMLVEMLTLQKPYPHYSSEQHAEFVCKRGERPILVQYGIPAILQELLEQAWCQDIRQRLSMKEIYHRLHSLVAYSDEELSQIAVTSSLSSTGHTATTKEEPSQVYFEFPEHFQQLIQDCEILSQYSDMGDECMDLTLATTASTTWQDSVSTFF